MLSPARLNEKERERERERGVAGICMVVGGRAKMS